MYYALILVSLPKKVAHIHIFWSYLSLNFEDKLNRKDFKVVANWIYFAISDPMLLTSPRQAEQFNKWIVKMFLKKKLWFIDICAIFDEDVNLKIAEFLISHTLQMFNDDIHL